MPEYQYPLNIRHESHIHIVTKKYHMPKTDNTSSEIKKGERLGDSYFYIPNSLASGSGTNWVPEDINALTQEAVGGSTETSGVGTLTKWLGASAKTAIGLFEKIAPGVSTNVNKLSGATAGILMKPNSLLVLNSVQRYSLNLNFELTPQSPEEGRMVMEIIKKWREWSLPTLKIDSARTWVDYPPIFDIYVKTGSAGISAVSSKSFSPANDFFNYNDMVLENFSLTTNGGQNESLFYEDGTPITSNLTLLFKSLRPGWNNDETKK